jgi:hypothetical protein
MNKRFSSVLLGWMLGFCAIAQGGYVPGPYVGLGLEYQRFMGEREDEIIVSNNKGINNYGPRKDFNSDNAGFEGFWGWLYPGCWESVLIGWEAYAAYDFNKDSRSGYTDTALKISSLNRNFSAGILFKAGVVLCDDYFVYGLVGPDVGYFKWTQSEEEVEGEGESFYRKEALIGIRYGVGIERDFCCFRIGLQVDYTHYNPKAFSPIDSNGDVCRSHFSPNVLNVGLRLSVPLSP